MLQQELIEFFHFKLIGDVWVRQSLQGWEMWRSDRDVEQRRPGGFTTHDHRVLVPEEVVKPEQFSIVLRAKLIEEKA